jgi:hypothetical protein
MQACIEREEKYEQLSSFEKSMKHFSLNAHAYGHIDCLKLFEVFFMNLTKKNKI